VGHIRLALYVIYLLIHLAVDWVRRNDFNFTARIFFTWESGPFADGRGSSARSDPSPGYGPVLVLVLRPKVSVLVLVLMPRVSVLVLKVLGLGHGLETSLWLLNKRKVLHFIFKFVGKNCTKFPVPNNAPAVWENIFAPYHSASAPVERIFSHSGLLIRPNRARMGDRLLSQLVFLRCNNAM